MENVEIHFNLFLKLFLCCSNKKQIHFNLNLLIRSLNERTDNFEQEEAACSRALPPVASQLEVERGDGRTKSVVVWDVMLL